MGNTVRVEGHGVAVSLTPNSAARVSFHHASKVETLSIPNLSVLIMGNTSGDEVSIFLPPTVAQAMKSAFDKAMAELSKEDAA